MGIWVRGITTADDMNPALPEGPIFLIKGNAGFMSSTVLWFGQVGFRVLGLGFRVQSLGFKV